MAVEAKAISSNRHFLWPAMDSEAQAPSLCLFPTEAAKPRGHVLVVPGGGYSHYGMHEGECVARRFMELGFDASVLWYRLGSSGWHHPAQLNDAQRAVRMLRHMMRRGSQRQLPIAVLGFSAGGHLTASLGVYHDQYGCAEDDLAASHSARPDALVLCYPVIDMLGEARHCGSVASLLGPAQAADAELRRAMSLHEHVTADAPPAFLWHCIDDEAVTVENSWLFASACRAAMVPVELHVYDAGGHGPGLGDGRHGARCVPSVVGWPELATAFLQRHLPEPDKLSAC